VGAATKVDIASSTDATPIVITTAAPHGFTAAAQPTDTVEVEGHLVNTNANGVWQVTVISATTFSLDGSAGTGGGAGGATGYVYDYSVKPFQTIPADGDLSAAAAWNPAVENIANAVPFSYRLHGKWRLFDIYHAGSAVYNSSASVSTLASGAFANLTGLAALLGFAGGAHSPVAQAGDLLQVTFTCSYITASGPGVIGIAPAIQYAAAGYNRDAMSGVFPETPAPSASHFPLSLLAQFVNGGAARIFDFSIQGNLQLGASSTLTIGAPYALTVMHYRAN
jgi:hypothetical protein